MTFSISCETAGYTDVERGERGSTEEHLTVTQFKVQAEQQRLEAVTGQVAQAEQSIGGCQSCHGETEKETGSSAKGNQGCKDHCS
jgi:cytochrome c553